MDDEDELKDDELDPAALIDIEDEEDELELPLDDDDLLDEDDLDPTNLGKLGFGIEEEDEFI